MEGLDLKLVALKVERLHLEKTRFSGEAQKPGWEKAVQGV
jgi:hypothetical protein